jgi:hypothetical protein
MSAAGTFQDGGPAVKFIAKQAQIRLHISDSTDTQRRVRSAVTNVTFAMTSRFHGRFHFLCRDML